MLRKLIESEIHWFYPWLKLRARQLLALEFGRHTLQPTVLTHEVLAKLMEWNGDIGAEPALSLKKLSGTIARQTIIDAARRRRSRTQYLAQLGNGAKELSEVEMRSMDRVRTAMSQLRDIDPILARLVELKCLEGYTLQEAASKLDVSERTAARRWRFAKAWLARALEE